MIGTADVTRAQDVNRQGEEALASEMPVMASAPAAPPVAPIVPGATPLGPLATQAFIAGPERTASLIDARGAAQAPAITAARGALAAPLPSEDALKSAEDKIRAVAAQQPMRGPRAFLAPIDGEDPVASINKLVQAIGLFAGGIGLKGSAHGAARASVAALTGALAGWNAGDRERADRELQTWKLKSDEAMKNWQLEQAAYQRALTARGLTLDQRMKEIQLVAAEYDNPIAAEQLRSQGMMGFVDWVTKRQEHADTIGVQTAKILAATKGDTITTADGVFRVTFDAAGNEMNRVRVGDRPPGQGTIEERVARAESAYAADPSPENKAKLDEANRALKHAENLAGIRAGAKAQTELDVKRNAPMTPKETEGLINPNTLTGPPPGISTNDAIRQGYVEVDEKDRASIAELKSTQAIVNTLTEMTRKLITAKTPTEAASQYASLTAGARTGSNALARTYEQTRDSFLGTVARALGGERGVLTNQDIDRINKSFPGFFDTRPVAEAKERMLDLLIDTSMRARVAKMTKQPFDDKAFRSRIDTIISGLENAGGAPGGAKVRVIGPKGESGTADAGVALPPGWRYAR